MARDMSVAFRHRLSKDEAQVVLTFDDDEVCFLYPDRIFLIPRDDVSPDVSRFVQYVCSDLAVQVLDSSFDEVVPDMP